MRKPQTLCLVGAAVVFCGLVPAAGGQAAGVPACAAGDYSLELAGWNVRGRVVAAAGIVTDRAPACRLKTDVRITVRYHRGSVVRPGGPVRLIRGNAGSWRVSRVLQPWSAVVHTWTWRNWCHSPRRGFIVTARANGTQTGVRRVVAPACRDRHSPSRLVDTGSGTRRIPSTGDRIPAHILSPDTPPPVSPALIRVKNAWLVSDGRTLVAVYAGEAGNDPADGLFVVIRQNLVFGLQWRDIIPAGHSGAVRLTRVPTGAAVETSAQRADLSFLSNGGESGVLHLATDAVEPTPSWLGLRGRLQLPFSRLAAP